MYDFFEILSLILQITGFAYLCLVGSNYTGAEYISESELSCLIEVINKSCFTYAEIKQTLFHWQIELESDGYYSIDIVSIAWVSDDQLINYPIEALSSDPITGKCFSG